MQLLGYFFLFSGALMMIWIYFDTKRWFAIQKYTKTEGKVIRIDTEPWTDESGQPSEIRTPVVMFSVGDEKNHYFGLLSEYSTEYPVGKQVAVMFPPNQPEKAELFDRKRWINDFLWHTIGTIANILLGIIFVYLPGPEA